MRVTLVMHALRVMRYIRIEEHIIVESEVIMPVTVKCAVFWLVISCNSGEARRFGRPYRFHLLCRRARQEERNFVYYSNLKMVALCSTETSIFSKTTQHCSQEDRTLDNLLVSDAIVSHVCNMQYKVAEILIIVTNLLNKKVLLTNQGSLYCWDV
jgi:hypothetical protein